MLVLTQLDGVTDPGLEVDLSLSLMYKRLLGYPSCSYSALGSVFSPLT